MSRNAALRIMARRRGKVDATERLKLAETLLGTDDLATCAQRALDWLGRSAGVARLGSRLKTFLAMKRP